MEVAKELAQEAGALALDYQRRGVTAETKADESPVTAADRACEKLILDRLARGRSRLELREGLGRATQRLAASVGQGRDGVAQK